ncbi:MAG: HlyD family secretion protein, partial [Candidatus Binatia bacterium]
MHKRTLFLSAVAIAALLAGAGYGLWRLTGSGGEFVVSGTIEADDIHVGSKVGGRVLKVVAREGQSVKAGDILVLLEPDELNASLAEAQASLRQAEAKLAELKAGYRTEEIEQAEANVKQHREELGRLLAGPRRQEVDQARAEWLATKAQHENAERFSQRMKELADRQLVASQEYDDARAKAEEAEQRMRSARERYELLLAGTRKEEIAQAGHRLEEAEAKLRQLRSGHRKEEIAQSRAGVEMARARVEILKTQLSETVIKSPVDAVVEVLDLEPGDLVAAGRPMATLIRADSLWVRAFVPEDKLGRVEPGVKVTIRVDSFPGRNFSGVVRR